MSSYSVKVYNRSNKILTIDLWGIQEFIKDEEDIIFLKKNLNFMIGLFIGRIPADNERRRTFLHNVRNNKSDDKYQEVFVRYLAWYQSIPNNPYYSHFLEEISDDGSILNRPLPNYVKTQRDKNIIDHELSNIRCKICNGFIAQKRIDFFLEEDGIEANLCFNCAEKISERDKSVTLPDKHPQPTKGQENCPRCKSPTWVQQRHDDQHYFLACSSFPKCRWTKDL